MHDQRLGPSRWPPSWDRSARGHARLGAHRAEHVRRPGRTDRRHAPRAGGATPLGQRTPVPARPELLHDPARSRGAAARHVHRLAHARSGRWRDRGRAVRTAGFPGDVGARRDVRALRQHHLGLRAAVRPAGRGRRHRRRGGAAHRPTHPAHPRAPGSGDRVVRRDLLPASALPAHRDRSRAGSAGSSDVPARSGSRSAPSTTTSQPTRRARCCPTTNASTRAPHVARWRRRRSAPSCGSFPWRSSW